MTHPLVDQLRFARSELLRALDGVTDEEARRRFEPMNSISWMVGHLANQENSYWVFLAQGKKLEPGLRDLVGYGQPASTPPLADMWAAWRAVTTAADEYLDIVTPEILQTHFEWRGEPLKESAGTLLQRTIYHYWYHIGESQAVRQLLGHTGLPEFVGDIGEQAPYRPT
jgi:uncharacterized damage-inducible protein DinB